MLQKIIDVLEYWFMEKLEYGFQKAAQEISQIVTKEQEVTKYKMAKKVWQEWIDCDGMATGDYPLWLSQQDD